LSQRHGATLFMILLAAFDALLFRYTAQADFAVGSPVASRNRSEIEGLIGFFVNTLVLRADLSGDPDFSELIDRVRKVCIEAYSNEELPFEKLIDEIRPTRDMSYSPLFQVMFAFQNVPGAAIELPELTLAPISIDCGSSMFDLTLFMWEDDKGLSGRIEYSTDLFNAETVERFIGHFRTLLESVVADPSRRLSDLAFLPDAERHQLLVTWNDTYAHYPEKCVNRLFEEQAERTSDSVAVICAGRSLSYGELNRRANRVANHLLGRGAKPDDIIGIYTDRSIDMVVGLMGILKAGSAYTPLDPGFPEDRVEFMLQDSNSRILITQSHLKGNIDFPGQMICIDSDWETISREKDNNPAPLCEPDNLAYVIYTSGSTGKPKGVQIPHRALVNFLYSMEKKPGLTREDIVLSVTTMSFDIFGLELFLPLLFGGKVVIAERDDTLDGLRLASMIEEHGVSIMQATPSTWRLLIESGWSGHESLKAICGGEAFPLDLVGPMLSRCKELWNLYGPTETTIWSTAFRIRSEDEPVLIGYPIDNTQIYILDNSLQPLPIGLVGELHIGGDGLSRGYLNRPELTAEKFIPHPLSDKPGARIYKTGDLARYRPDGSIECLGRIDHQVKLRGFRIELGEIEARIKDIEAVSNCVVALREDRPGDRRLVAYYVARDGAAISVPDARGYLQSKLPEYMVPQHFAKLEAIPLTPNGKVDKKALPKPVLEELSQEMFVAPRTEVESAVASVWQQVLKVDRVSVNSNFFELGGHSLLMVQVLNRIRGFSDKNIPIMALFQHPTIASLANYLAGQQPDQLSVGSEQIRPVSRGRDLELSFAQQRLWFLNQLEPDSVAYNLSGGVKLKGRLRVDILNQSLSEIILRHETLRTTFHEKDGKPIQVISPPSGLDIPVIDLHLQSGADRQAEIDQIIRKQAQDPFDLSKGPLLRSVLLRLDQEEHILLLTMQHIITDGWSYSIFASELETLYTAFSQGKPSPLPAPAIQYADFAYWQREWLQGEVLDAQLGYWKKQLSPEPPALQLPTDRPRPAVQTHRGAHLPINLPLFLADKVKELSQRHGATLFMILLAAFDALLFRYTAQADFAVGSPVASRN
ncbi:MAG: amino acid adenylation domain-containing protein, partial [Syntrophobacteraceae bacterium]